MRIALGNDHAGYPMKDHVRRILEEMGHEVLDRGAPDETPVDFPDIVRDTCTLVRTGEADRAILVCGTGAGAAIAANKLPGIRCALAHDVYSAHQAVEHDDVNTIAMGAWVIGPAIAREVIVSFLAARFDDDQDTRRRVNKLRQMELDAAADLRSSLRTHPSPNKN